MIDAAPFALALVVLMFLYLPQAARDVRRLLTPPPPAIERPDYDRIALLEHDLGLGCEPGECRVCDDVAKAKRAKFETALGHPELYRPPAQGAPGPQGPPGARLPDDYPFRPWVGPVGAQGAVGSTGPCGPSRPVVTIPSGLTPDQEAHYRYLMSTVRPIYLTTNPMTESWGLIHQKLDDLAPTAIDRLKAAERDLNRHGRPLPPRPDHRPNVER